MRPLTPLIRMEGPFASTPGEHTLNIRPPLWLPIAVAVIIGGMYIGGKFVETRYSEPTLITVSGEGDVMAVPDIAELRVGVQTGPKKTAKEAMTALEKSMNEVLASVRAMKIEEKDIRTEQLMLNPSYDWSDGKQTLRGYEATQSLVVKVRDMDNVGNVLSGVANVGENQIGGVQFTIDDSDTLREQARKEAIEKAQAKAQKLASDLGMRLGKIKGYNEGGDYVLPPMPYAARGMGGEVAMDMAQQAIDVPQGGQEGKVTINFK